MYTWKLLGNVLRRFDANYSHNGGRLAFVKHRVLTYDKFGSYRKEVNQWFREQGKQVAQACRRQFEFITAQRIRRNVQIFYLYTRIWDEVALREFIKSWRLRVTRNFLLSTVAVTMYNWDHDRITDEELNKYIHEIERIHRLRDCTVVCAKCHLRIIVDVIQANVKYCKCNGVQSTTSSQNTDGWLPYIERQDMLIWRRQETGGLYAYKVYGSFSDVTAEDFLQAQVDVDYRLEWDSTAKELEIIETDPKSKSSDQSNDIIHWEMLWPRFFSNRDYVFQRRWIVNREKGIIIIVSRVTEHPNVPIIRGIHRVKSYWSYMVIRPCTEFSKPGIEFGLTYFDDPGVSIPSPFTSWVALRGLPDFLTRMRNASKNYQKYKATKQREVIFNNDNYPLPEEQVKSDTSANSTNELEIIHNVQQESDIVENGNRDTASNSSDEKQGLHYFYLTKLFA
ncbi:stAR-related lipid transfer protein 7, mitochondrial-like isoform X2 [Odontomachus brunneus]|uniref:stAR-related lipid transfer protein 7, mitochondrial-like isoform X2 n=1 Tax=Odontomachus brunneus TaxID=486640 RepID=UPI0013F19F16|nr:stAR-related lipid transfer protein 7, mitochondrial-like isoform X2 [Odontomachus brunneus]